MIAPVIPSIFGIQKESVRTVLLPVLNSRKVNAIHFDIVAVGSENTYFNTIETFNELGDLLIGYGASADLHLLTSNPLSSLRSIATKDFDFPIRISFHVESDTDEEEFFGIAHEVGFTSGIAVKLKTPINNELPGLHLADYIHLICNDEEVGIGAFQMQIFEKIIQLQKIKPNVDVTLDCGVKGEHIVPSMKAGARNLIMGSAIFKNQKYSPLEAATEFDKMARAV